MTRHKHSDSTLIDTVGVQYVTTTFGLSPQRLHMWRKRGIPQLSRIAFAKLCAERGVIPPADFFGKFEVTGRAA